MPGPSGDSTTRTPASRQASASLAAASSPLPRATRTCRRSPKLCTSRTAGSAADDLRGHVLRVCQHFEQVVRKRRAQRVRLVERQDAALAHQRHARAALGFVEVGRGHEDRDALRQELGQQAPELAARHRVDARGRLVEQDDLRLVHQRARERQLLLHAARQALGQPRPERRQLHHVEQPVPALAVVRHAVDLGEEGDVLVDREVAVEAELLREVAHLRRDRVVLPDRVVAEHADGAAGGLEQPAQQPDRRRLARAVRADEAEHLALADGVRHAGDRLGRAEALRDAVQFKCGSVIALCPQSVLRVPTSAQP